MTAQRKIAEPPFSVPSLAARWECSEGLIRKMIDRGEIQAFRLGTLIRIHVDEVDRVECQNLTPSSASEAPMLSSTETLMESDAAAVSTPKIGRARKPRHGGSGQEATIHRGPWAG